MNPFKKLKNLDAQAKSTIVAVAVITMINTTAVLLIKNAEAQKQLEEN